LALSLASLGAQAVIAPDYSYFTLKSFHIHNCDANCHQENLLPLAGAVGYSEMADWIAGAVDGFAMLEEFEVFDCEQLVLVFVVDLVSEHYLGHFLLVVDLVVVALFGNFKLLSVSSERCVAAGPGYWFFQEYKPFVVAGSSFESEHWSRKVYASNSGLFDWRRKCWQDIS
jgi:hypothetical protein